VIFMCFSFGDGGFVLLPPLTLQETQGA